jgi:hypothetical protein
MWACHALNAMFVPAIEILSVVLPASPTVGTEGFVHQDEPATIVMRHPYTFPGGGRTEITIDRRLHFETTSYASMDGYDFCSSVVEISEIERYVYERLGMTDTTRKWMSVL